MKNGYSYYDFPNGTQVFIDVLAKNFWSGEYKIIRPIGNYFIPIEKIVWC